MIKKAIVVFIMASAVWVSSVLGAQPIDVLRGPIEQVVALLRDPQYKEPARREAQREKIWVLIREVFDFTEISMRALAQNWRAFTPQERKEFVDVFTDHLGNTYIEKIQGEYHDERVEFTGEQMLSDTKALVKTQIQRQGVEIPIDYSMRLRNDLWRVYDINVEGVSLVGNFRSQFASFFAKTANTPTQLIDKLKKKSD
jgi:phospholipid transport system substrate-binding protein